MDVDARSRWLSYMPPDCSKLEQHNIFWQLSQTCTLRSLQENGCFFTTENMLSERINPIRQRNMLHFNRKKRFPYFFFHSFLFIASSSSFPPFFGYSQEGNNVCISPSTKVKQVKTQTWGQVWCSLAAMKQKCCTKQKCTAASANTGDRGKDWRSVRIPAVCSWS